MNAPYEVSGKGSVRSDVQRRGRFARGGGPGRVAYSHGRGSDRLRRRFGLRLRRGGTASCRPLRTKGQGAWEDGDDRYFILKTLKTGRRLERADLRDTDLRTVAGAIRACLMSFRLW